MPDFRTKGRGENRQVFPISGGTEHRVKDDYEQDNPPESETLGQKIQEEGRPEEEVLEEKIQEEKMEEQKKQKKHKLEKPPYTTKHVVRRDIKGMMRKQDADEYGSKDYVNYKRKLDREADRTYSKENKKAKKRRKKETKKEEKQREKQETKK